MTQDVDMPKDPSCFPSWATCSEEEWRAAIEWFATLPQKELLHRMALCHAQMRTCGDLKHSGHADDRARAKRGFTELSILHDALTTGGSLEFFRAYKRTEDEEYLVGQATERWRERIQNSSANPLTNRC